MASSGILARIAGWLRAIPIVIVAPWMQCALLERAGVPPTAGSMEPPLVDHAPTRVTETPPRRPEELVRLSDAVVVRALDRGRGGFRMCVERARRTDPTIDGKVSLRVYVDPLGVAVMAESTVADPKLARCLVAVAKRLTFPPPGQDAVADIAFVAR